MPCHTVQSRAPRGKKKTDVLVIPAGWSRGRHAGTQAAPQSAQSLVHWAVREKRETTPRRSQPHREERKHKTKTRARGLQCQIGRSRLFLRLMRERGAESDFGESDYDGRKPAAGEAEKTHSTGRPGHVTERPKRRRRRRRGQTKKPRAALAWKAPGERL